MAACGGVISQTVKCICFPYFFLFVYFFEKALLLPCPCLLIVPMQHLSSEDRICCNHCSRGDNITRSSAYRRHFISLSLTSQCCCQCTSSVRESLLWSRLCPLRTSTTPTDTRSHSWTHTHTLSLTYTHTHTRVE